MPLAWISSSGDGDDKSSHVLGAFDYRIEGEDAYILCYDCNLPGVRKELKLSGYRNAGAAWSFETLGWSGSEGGNSENYFTYYTPEGESSLFIYAQQAGPDVLLSAADADALDQATAAGGLKLTSISCLADAGSLSGGLA